MSLNPVKLLPNWSGTWTLVLALKFMNFALKSYVVNQIVEAFNR